ncbi:hypothetical protein [Persicitalea jodogahamensis]|uniref:Beta-lactamase-inhibitor-like PepSY-like domain-containing protein n=1 Tax=Persicitalea jodogahamensis TaxID=402147 RepID=A0A8J3D1J1_9BACT|nr:hypothetical protein [Persicitalea jodogahamensis]GHB56912.1 hypothetical protein GCM10007390_07900 [Persicitalea jodogahamensis]
MKTNVFLVVAFLCALTMSCQKDTLDPTANTDFASVVLSAARYSVEADSTTRMHCKGKLTELAEADIPAAVSAYIATNYDGATLKFAGADASGNVVVGLTLADGTHKGLIFDSTGAFVKELSHYSKRAKLTEVAVADLPASVSAYVVANYAGAEIKRAGTNGAGEYFVMLSTADKPVVLLFNADGTFGKALEKTKGHGNKRFGPGGHK